MRNKPEEMVSRAGLEPATTALKEGSIHFCVVWNTSPKCAKLQA